MVPSAAVHLTQWRGTDPQVVEATFEQMEQALAAIERLPIPTIASVAGVATGAGCQLAMSCDLRVLNASARIGMPIARLGILISPAFVSRLVRCGGDELTCDLLFTGRLLDASEALQRGMAGSVVDDDDLQTATEALAHKIASLPSVSVRAAKHSIARVRCEAADDSHHAWIDRATFRVGLESILADRPRA